MMKTKLLLLSFAALLLAAGCASTEKLVSQGKYDEAIEIAVRKLSRNPENTKQISVLKKAFELAQEQDRKKISYLQTKGQPDRWDAIYELYVKMDRRQDKIKPLLPLYLNGKEVNFKLENYTRKIIEAESRAADYHYAMAQKLMAENNKFAYRQAYDELQKVLYFSPASDVSQMLQECLEKGRSHILLVAINKTVYRLPASFMADLIRLPVEQLNSMWIRYYTKDIRNGNYDGLIQVVLRQADITAEKEEEREYTQKRRIKDGYEYKLDSNGNIVKDSLGNPVKVPKYRTIICNVREVRQFKAATIEGYINFMDNYTKESLQMVNIKADNVFENFYATIGGNEQACNEDVLKLAEGKPLPFPRNIEMILGTKETLKEIIWKALQDHRTFVEQNF